MMRLKIKRKGFTLIEALIAIWAMTVTAAAILSTFVSSSQLRIFSENFTIGINACQEELEAIRYHYESDTEETTRLTLDNIFNNYNANTPLDKAQNGRPVIVFDANGAPNDDFGGRIITSDPANPNDGMFAQVTARMAFRQGRRIVGGTLDNSGNLVPDGDTPCQLTILLAQ